MSDISKHIFVIGCPRSGTTWVRHLLGSHPEIAAAPSETRLFTAFLGPLTDRWYLRPDGGPHLDGTISEARFLELCREMADGVFEDIVQRKPGARVVLEKTPWHARRTDLILRLFPDASFVHVVRDPRAVVRSIRTASRTWRPGWPGTVIGAAEVWRHDVALSMDVCRATKNYTELKYEQLHQDAVGQLQRIFRWVGVSDDVEVCCHALEQSTIEKMSRYAPDNAFYGKGLPDTWKSELTPRELSYIEGVAGEQMDRLGYPRSQPGIWAGLAALAALASRTVRLAGRTTVQRLTPPQM